MAVAGDTHEADIPVELSAVSQGGEGGHTPTAEGVPESGVLGDEDVDMERGQKRPYPDGDPRRRKKKKVWIAVVVCCSLDCCCSLVLVVKYHDIVGHILG